MARIGYQNGIKAAKARMKKLDPGGFNASGTGAWDKFFATVDTLVQDHDMALDPPPRPDPAPQPPPPDPTPAPSGFAPQAYNKGSRGQNARYNVHINCTQTPTGWVDGRGVNYDEGGLCRGGRSENDVPGLKPADMMDGLEPWDPYEWQGKTFPPYPAASYLQ